MVSESGGYDILSGLPHCETARQYLSKYPCWKDIVGITEKFLGIARLIHYPPSHLEIHFAHEMLFRFWDLISILIPAMTMFYEDDTPMTEAYIILKLRENVANHWNNVFDSDLLETARNPGRVLTEDVKRTKLIIYKVYFL